MNMKRVEGNDRKTAIPTGCAKDQSETKEYRIQKVQEDKRSLMKEIYLLFKKESR